MVGFNQEQHEFEQFLQKGIPIILNDIQIQENKFTQKLEVVLKKYTKMEQSLVKFEIKDITTLGSDTISIAELTGKSEYERVTVKAKVINMEPPAKVGQNKTKQEIFIADKTATANLTVWEGDVDKLEIGESYQFNRLVVRFYRGKKHLSYPSWGATRHKIDDIGEVLDEDCNLDNEDTLIQSVNVIGVHLEQVYNCFYCKKGNVEPKEG